MLPSSTAVLLTYPTMIPLDPAVNDNHAVFNGDVSKEGALLQEQFQHLLSFVVFVLADQILKLGKEEWTIKPVLVSGGRFHFRRQLPWPTRRIPKHPIPVRLVPL